jgi:hypothetical protein
MDQENRGTPSPPPTVEKVNVRKVHAAELNCTETEYVVVTRNQPAAEEVVYLEGVARSDAHDLDIRQVPSFLLPFDHRFESNSFPSLKRTSKPSFPTLT